MRRSIKNGQFKNFYESRDFVRTLGLKSASEWRSYARSDKRPLNIPSHPDRHYKNNDWISWSDWLGTNNVPGSVRKYFVNDDYFRVWSSNMSYILGFWFADGYINEKTGTFIITQHKKDIQLLIDMLRIMGSNYPLKKHQDNNLAFKITSRTIVNDIVRIGGCQGKSKRISFPSQIPNEYIRDFIRGFWDGDGSVYCQKSGKSYCSSITSASPDMIEGLLAVLRRDISGFSGTINTHDNYATLFVGVNDTRRLASYFYSGLGNDDLFMPRKKEKFLNSGNIVIASFNKEFLSFENAKHFIRENGIKRISEWDLFRKKHKIENIPANPEMTYKNMGWSGWKNFAETSFLPFDEARAYVRTLEIKGAVAWRIYASTAARPINIPSNPWSVYKTEWAGIRDWTNFKNN